MMVQDVEITSRTKMKTPKQIHDAEGYCAVIAVCWNELKFPDLSEELIEKSLRLLIDNKHSLRTFIKVFVMN